MSDSDGWEITDDQERARKGPKADATLSKFFKAGKYMRKCKRKDHKCLKCDWFVPAARAHNGVLRNHLLHDCPNMSPLERMQVRADNADKMVTGREVQSMLSQPSKKQKQADIRSMIADSTITRLSHDARNAANEYWLRFFVTELQDEEGIPPPQPVLPVQPPGGFATWTEAVFDAIGPWDFNLDLLDPKYNEPAPRPKARPVGAQQEWNFRAAAAAAAALEDMAELPPQ